ncbi:hypothetical protein EC973_007927 [Apophysomyces ossiformis]|uniref:BTB domain-containing protein n=1 Tax=Apophysomyces ossiformis TaxID=679940 RepID=A0A8H7BTH9_9FUNG|nr:hypothetical protein EC973_007927 [Apophysomyces ossiformis]
MPHTNDVLRTSSSRLNNTTESMHEPTTPSLFRSNEASPHRRDITSRAEGSSNSPGDRNHFCLPKTGDNIRRNDLTIDAAGNLPSLLKQIEDSTLPNHSKYDWRLHSLTLCRHILTRGLMDGIGSDVVVHVPAWGKTYHLHRLILDQNPYFRLLLHGGFRETSSDNIVLNFEKSQYITAESFHFVLARLYGTLFDPDITQENVRQILATCSFFQLQYMSDLCVEYILRTLDEYNFIDYLTFADENLVYGSERICDAIFTYLCREAYTMDRKRLAAVPVRWLKKLIESDAFWVPRDEAQEDRQEKTKNKDQKDEVSSLSECTTIVTSSDEQVEITRSVSTDTADDQQKRSSFAPSTLSMDSSSLSDEEKSRDTDASDDDAASICSFTMKELDVYQETICRSIHYIHMTFEQLESVASDRNPFTKEELIPQQILKDALWRQIEMRAKIERASERQTELGLTVPSSADTIHDQSMQNNAWIDSPMKDDNLYLIPTNDTTTYTGESALSCASSTTAIQTKCSSATKCSTDGTGSNKSTSNGHQYAIYPPFRFSVEFTDVSSLKHGVRVYSKTVFYAGYVKNKAKIQTRLIL